MSDVHEPTAAEGVEDPLGPPGEVDGDVDVASTTTEAPPSGADDDGAGPTPEADAADGPPAEPPSVEELIALLETASTERNDYLDRLRRAQADFENSKKRLAKQATDDAVRAVEGLVEQLLPVLDACDGAITHGATEVEPIYAALLGTLEKQGLERLDPTGQGFDPTLHEAVMHEPAADGDDGTVVSAVMRAGYTWKGRVVRPAMVKVRG